MSLNLSAVFSADGMSLFGPPDGAPSVFGLDCCFAFAVVVSLGSSFVYGMMSGVPGGMYFLNTSGTSKPSSFW